MTHYRISEAARLLGLSDDTVRRWVSTGVLPATKDEAGRRVISGADLAARAKAIASRRRTRPGWRAAPATGWSGW